MLQQSDEWFASRCGAVTASRVADATAGGKGVSRNNYMAQLIAERLTGRVAETYTNAAMEHGSETEADARAAYEFLTGTTVERVGFINHPAIEMAGASPDGLVGNDGLVEFKCPNTKTHIDTLLGASISGKYIKQMQWQMACTERSWCDFVSYDPRMPMDMMLHIKRVHLMDEIGEFEEDIRNFITEMEVKIEDLRKVAAK